MSTQQNLVDETAPLLAEAAQQQPPASVDNNEQRYSLSKTQPIRQHFSKWRNFYICAAFLIVVETPAYTGEAPRLRMLEIGACREYYAAQNTTTLAHHGGDIPERLCKLAPIQSTVAKMRGILNLLEAVPGLLLAVPFGILADKKGRRFVINICMIGLLLREVWTFTFLYFSDIFPLRSVYFAPLMLVIGGGSIVGSSMLLAVVAASVPQESRTQAFFMFHVIMMLVEVAAPPLASLLMNKIGAHLTFLATIPVEAASLILLVFLSEPKPSGQLEEVEAHDPVSTLNRPKTMLGRLKQAVNHTTHSLRYDIAKFLANRVVFVTISAVVLAKMGRPVLELTLQFMSSKFKWPISKVSCRCSHLTAPTLS